MQTPIRVLLLETSQSDAEFFQRLIPASHKNLWQVIHLQCLSEALTYAGRSPIHVILSGLHLPDANGLAVVKALRQTYPDVPLVVLTHVDNDRLGLEALRHGAQDYLVKTNITFPLLERSLRYSIERARNQVLMQQNEQRLEQLIKTRTAQLQSTNSLLLMEVVEREKSEARYRAIVEAQTEMVVRAKPDTTITFVNEATCRVLHCTRETVIGKPWLSFLQPDEQRQTQAQIAQLTPDRPTFISEQQIDFEGTGDRWYEWVNTGIFEQGVLVDILGVGRDITDRKRNEAERELAEAALRQSEGKHRALIHALPDLVMRMTGDGTYLDFFSPTAFKTFGHQHLIGKSLRDSPMPPELMDLRLNAIHKALQTGELQVYEQRVPIQDGERIEEVRISSCGADEVLVIVRDVSDRKQAENALHRLNHELEARVEQRTAALRESEGRFRQIFEQSPVGIAISDLDGRITRANSSLACLLDCVPGDLKERYIQDFLQPQGQDPIPQLQGLMEHTLTAVSFENQPVSCKDRTLWVNVTSALIFNGFGRPAGIVHLIEDITDRKVTEAILQQSEARYRAVVEDQTELICRFSVDGTINFVNAAYCRYFQVDAADLLGKSFWQFIPSDNQDFVRRKFQALSCDYPTTSYEHRVTLDSGEVRWQAWTDRAIFDPAGQLVEFQSVGRDITERKRAEETLKRQLATIEAAGDGIGILKGNVHTFANRAYLELFGFQSPTELLGKPWHELYAPEEFQRFEQEVFPMLAQQRVWKGEAVGTRQDGRTFVQEVSLTLTEQGELICICADISDRKQTEAELKRINEQLTLTNAELHRATRLKDEFLATMSHELRTPLNAILGMSEGLQDDVFGPLSDRQLKAIETIERSGKHLLDLINDILDLSKVEAGKLELQRATASVHALCDRSLAFVRQQALKKGIELIDNIPPNLPEIWVDERRMCQVLVNLLSNAVKFTPDGGKVRLAAHCGVKAQQAFLYMSVIDTGIGIASEDMESLFEPFVQIDSRLNRQHEGTGLGLSLVRRLTLLHQGTVTVMSEPNQGSCFTVCLPYLDESGSAIIPPDLLQPAVGHRADDSPNGGISESKGPAQIPAEVRAVPPGSLQAEQPEAIAPAVPVRPPLILIAEDNEANLVTLANYLSARGYQLVFAKDGEEAIARTQAERPDLILMDIQMPGMDGLEAIRQIRAWPDFTQVPILALTALAMEEDRDACLAAGASDYFTKPFKLKHLVETIEKELDLLKQKTKRKLTLLRDS